MKILVLNAGSSTLKCAIFSFEGSKDPQCPLWRGILDWGQGLEKAFLSYITDHHHLERMTLNLSSPNDSFDILLKTSWEGPGSVISGPHEIHAVGHRVVHGGKRFMTLSLITDEVKREIKKLEILAPLHNPYNLKGIEVVEKLLPDTVQYAAFDTSYHATMSEEVSTYPIPQTWRDRGIRRYGFHGISHQYCAEKAVAMIGSGRPARKIITCHLGNGSSLCATKDGHCVETTMGFTPLEGLMMGTRSGSLDPGIIIQMLKEGGVNLEEVEKSLWQQSGLLGISGFSDMRYIQEEKKQGNEKADLAFKMYIHRLKSHIGSMAAAIDGLDVLVFTAGIGENSHLVRECTSDGLSHLGIKLDQKKNNTCVPDQDIADAHSKVRVLVLHTREEYAIAKSVEALESVH